MLILIAGIVIILDILLIVGFVYVLRQAWPYRPQFTIFTRPPRRILTLRDTVLRERWLGIVNRVNLHSTESMKIAVIEADKMADDILKRLGLGGQHMADRLAQMNQNEFKSLKRLWNAHRFRNTVVHSPEVEVTPERVRRILDDYRAFFTEVGIL